MVIETERLRIVPFAEEHLTYRYVGWLNDPETVRYSEQRLKHHTLETCREYVESFRETPHHLLALLHRDPEIGHIGNMNAYVDVPNQVADLGIMIGERRFWGQRYAGEAVLGVCAYMFQHANIRKLTCGVLSVNDGTLAFLRRLGCEEEARRKRHVLFEGREVDVVHMTLFKEQWLELHGPSPDIRIMAA
jgi:[ribosomal protein S5]-alanine N-acetyltransferase